jgi:Fe-coproporphyrin III synthase
MSSPRGNAGLASALVVQAITDAAAIGFDVLSVSGGEPLMLPDLPDLLAAGKAGAMHVQLATNGWFLASERMRQAAPFLDLVAVSLDGPPALHNHMRGNPQAFARLEAGLPVLREIAAGRFAFGLIHTVTTESWETLPWLADFAATAGARLLQLHPLERAGRAADDETLALDADGLARAYILAAALRVDYAGRLHVHTDVLHRDHLPAPCDDADAVATLGTLVLEDDGTVVPYAYGFDRRFAVCNIHDTPLAAAWPGYAAKMVPELRRQVRALHAELSVEGGPDLFNWHERMVAASYSAPAWQAPVVA